MQRNTVQTLEEKIKEKAHFIRQRILEIEAELYRDDFGIGSNKKDALRYLAEYKNKLSILSVIEEVI